MELQFRFCKYKGMQGILAFGCLMTQVYNHRYKLVVRFLHFACLWIAENGGYPPTQNGDIRSLF